MFTGIVEETGRVRLIERVGQGARLVIRGKVAGKNVRLGDSISVNGCCLTAVRIQRTGGAKANSKGAGVDLSFDLLEETWNRTNLRFLREGEAVNLERALSAGGRLGGHLVTGHVDDTGVIRAIQSQGQDHLVDVEVPAGFHRWLVSKGSVTVDGISLTVARLLPRGFRVCIIPHTWKVTQLAQRAVGDRVNLEGDLIGKYVVQYWDRIQEARIKKQGRPLAKRSSSRRGMPIEG